MHYKSVFFLLSCCFIESCQLVADPEKVVATSATEAAKPKPINFFALIAEENLKSLVRVDTDNQLTAFLNSDETFAQLLQKNYEEQLDPKKLDKRKQVFELLKSFETTHPFSQEIVLDFHSVADLELILGPKSNPAHCVVANLDRSITEAGKGMFMYKVTRPTADLKALKKQQSVVRELCSNEKLFQELNTLTQALVLPENAFLSFWGQDMFIGCLKRDPNIVIPFFKKLEKRLNMQPIISDIGEKFDAYGKVFGCLSAAYMTGYMLRYWYKKNIQNKPLDSASHNKLIKRYFFDEQEKFHLFDDKGNLYKCEKTVPEWSESQWYQDRQPNLSCSWIYMSYFGLFYLLTKVFSSKDSVAESVNLVWNVRGFSWIRRFITEVFIFRKCLQAKLIHVATYINNAQKLISLALQNPVLAANIDLLHTIQESLDKKSYEVKHLLNMLHSSTFKGEASCWNQYTGRVFVVYQLMDQLKNELSDLLVAVGELDAQLSIARLYKEFENKRVKICFPTYLENATAPAVAIENFWNPMIDAEKVVPNSLTLGMAFDKRPNVVVTGPNAGGKSTIMKSFILSVIMAQSLGICTASSCTLTPFTKIMTYLNIVDDIAAGNSHFKAGVVRARELIECSNKLNKGGVALFAGDEVFNGTTHAEGQAAAFALLQTLGSSLSNMVIAPTHFPMVTGLEQQTETFNNYKVTVEYDEQGKIKYPYHLEPGIAHQNVAFKILSEEGFGDEFLVKATRCLG